MPIRDRHGLLGDLRPLYRLLVLRLVLRVGDHGLGEAHELAEIPTGGRGASALKPLEVSATKRNTKKYQVYTL